MSTVAPSMVIVPKSRREPEEPEEPPVEPDPPGGQDELALRVASATPESSIGPVQDSESPSSAERTRREPGVDPPDDPGPGRGRPQQPGQRRDQGDRPDPEDHEGLQPSSALLGPGSGGALSSMTVNLQVEDRAGSRAGSRAAPIREKGRRITRRSNAPPIPTIPGHPPGDKIVPDGRPWTAFPGWPDGIGEARRLGRPIRGRCRRGPGVL